MTKFDTSKINEIPLHDVVSRFATLRRSGAHQVALCPWHEDHHPSLVLYEGSGQNRCYCFACNNGGSVIDYVMQAGSMSFKDACQWLSSEFGIAMDDKPGKVRYRPMPVRNVKPAPEPVNYNYIPREYMERTVSAQSSFCQGLMKIFDPELVRTMAEEYCLGMLEDENVSGDVIFWHIDAEGRVCNGKVQRYCADVASPRFLHCERNVVYWLGKRLHSEGVVQGDPVFNSKCLFGEHLLPKYPSAMVVLVESAKNAVVGACQHPELVWVATGSSGALKRESLMALKGRNVVVYPDRDAIGAWKAEIDRNADIANFKVSDLCERIAPEGEAKYDVADYIIADRLKRRV